MRAMTAVRATAERFWMILLNLGEVVVHIQTVVEEGSTLNALHPLHCFEDTKLVVAVRHHPFVDVAGDLLVSLKQH